LLVKSHGAKGAGSHAHTTANTFFFIDFDGIGLWIAHQRFFLGAGFDARRFAALLAYIRVIEKVFGNDGDLDA
jgi:hypothetical protein